MYKIASIINFANPMSLEKNISRLKPIEYSDMISVLAEIHEYISNNTEASIEDASKEVIGDSNYYMTFSKLIKMYIGEVQFRTNEFSSISDGLDSYRQAEENPNLESFEQKEVEEKEELEQEEFDPLKDFKNIEFVEKELIRLINQEYKEEEKERVDIAFSNLKFHLEDLKLGLKEENYESIDNAAELIKDTIDFIDSLKKYVPIGEESSDEKEEEDEDEDEEVSKKRIVRPGETSYPEEERNENSSRINNLKNLTSDLGMEDVLSHPIARGIELISEEGLTIESIEKTSIALDSIYERAQGFFKKFNDVTIRYLEAHRKTLNEGGSDRRIFKKENFNIDRAVLMDFNNLIYAIRGVDLIVKNSIVLATRSGGLESGTSSKLSELKGKLLVNRFITDESFFRSYIVLTLLYFSSRNMGLLYAGIKEWKDFNYNETYTSLIAEYDKDVVKGRNLVEDTSEIIYKLIWSRFKKQLSLSSADIAENISLPMKNFLLGTCLQKDYVNLLLKRNLNSDLKGKVSVVKCPTCTRPIKWSGKPLKELDVVHSRGAYIPMYSFIGQRTSSNGKKQSFLISEQHLIDNGPYAPPDPSEIGFDSWLDQRNLDGTLQNKAKLLRRTRELVASYEGEKTWEEILEMIYSNDPALHEEGLQRRAGALAQLGALRLRYDNKVPITRDVSTMMYACPFQKDDTETSNEGGQFNLSKELNIIRNLEFPNDPEQKEIVNDILTQIDVLTIEFSDAVENGKDYESIQIELEDALDQAHAIAGSVRNSSKNEEEEEGGLSFSPSGCGLKLTPYSDDESSMSYGANSNPSSLSYTWNPKGLSESQESVARQRMAGGYKFSKTIFKCPTRIENPTSSDLIKFKNVAIPKAGPVGMSEGFYSPPTKSGSYAEHAEIEEGSFSYLICSASTSLSAFDKTRTSEGSIYAILRSLLNVLKGKSDTGSPVTNEQKKAAKEIIDFLILEGVDYNDIIKALDIAAMPPEEVLSSTAKLRKDRLKKIEKMLVLAARTMPAQFSEIEDLVLVCPHGHRFSIKQSINFSETHSVIKLSGATRGYAAAKELYILSGFESLNAAKRIGLIIKAAEFEELKTFKEIGSENHDISELAFIIPDQDGNPERWKFSPMLVDFIKKNAFSEYPGADHSDLPISLEYSKVKFGGQFLADLVNNSVSNGSSNQSVEEMGIGAAMSKTSSLSQSMPDDRLNAAEDLSKVSRAIDGIDPSDLSANIEALARALKGALKVVLTWNNRAIEPEFFNKVTASSDFNIDGVAEDIVEIPDLFYDSENVSPAAKMAVVTALKPRLKTYVVATNAFQSKDIIGSAASLATAALIDAVQNVERDSEFEIELDYDTTIFDWTYSKVEPYFSALKSELEKVQPYITHDDPRYIQRGKEYAASVKGLSMLVAILSYQKDSSKQERTLLRETYGKKIFLVAYAQYLSNALAIIYNECMAPDRCIPSAYIGYDIGLDLSSSKKILALSPEDLRLIQDNPKLRGSNKGIILRNVTAAYNNIIGKMKISRNMAITPIGLGEAKKELLRQAGSSNDPLAHATFSAAFPMQTMGFTSEYLAYSETNLPNSFGIRAGKGKAIPDEPSVLPPEMLNLVDSNGKPILSSSGQQKQIPVFRHPETGFDSSKFQIGMIMGKSQRAMTWPLDNANDYVGFQLPFKRDKVSASNISKASMLQVYDFRFVIDIEGVPQDISFLFRRGRNEEQEGVLASLYRKIDTLEEQRGDALEEASSSSEEDVINNFYDDAISEIHAYINRIPIYVKSGSSYVKNKNSILDEKVRWISEPHPTVLLVSPKEAFDLIDNVDRIKNMLVTEPNQELLSRFIINVYGLELIKDIVQEVYNKHSGDNKELEAWEIFSNLYIDPNTDEGRKIIQEINLRLNSEYSEHLGTFYEIIPSGAAGTGSHMTVIEASVPSFRVNKRSQSGFDVIPDDGLGVPPSIGKMGSKLAPHSPIANFFGEGDEDSEGLTYLQRAQEAMVEYVRSHASGELGQHVTEAYDKTEYFEKIARRRRDWERIILTMGEPDIYVDDIIQ